MDLNLSSPEKIKINASFQDYIFKKSASINESNRHSLPKECNIVTSLQVTHSENDPTDSLEGVNVDLNDNQKKFLSNCIDKNKFIHWDLINEEAMDGYNNESSDDSKLTSKVSDLSLYPSNNSKLDGVNFNTKEDVEATLIEMEGGCKENQIIKSHTLNTSKDLVPYCPHYKYLPPFGENNQLTNMNSITLPFLLPVREQTQELKVMIPLAEDTATHQQDIVNSHWKKLLVFENFELSSITNKRENGLAYTDNLLSTFTQNLDIIKDRDKEEINNQSSDLETSITSLEGEKCVDLSKLSYENNKGENFTGSSICMKKDNIPLEKINLTFSKNVEVDNSYKSRKRGVNIDCKTSHNFVDALQSSTEDEVIFKRIKVHVETLYHSEEEHTIKSNTLNTCKALVPYCPYNKYLPPVEKKNRNTEANIIPVPFCSLPVQEQPQELKVMFPLAEVSTENQQDFVNSHWKTLLLRKICQTNAIVNENKNGLIHTDNLVSTTAWNLNVIEDNIYQLGKKNINSQSLDSEPSITPMESETYVDLYKISYKSNEKENLTGSSMINDNSVTLEKGMLTSSENVENEDSNESRKRGADITYNFNSDFDTGSSPEDEILNKKIKLCIDALDYNLEVYEDDESSNSLYNNDVIESDLDEIIERSILKYEGFTAEKGVLATPTTLEQSSQTTCPLPGEQRSCKRCLFLDEDSNQLKKIKYTNNMRSNEIPAETDLPIFEESLSQFYITPSTTVPALVEEGKSEDENDTEKSMFGVGDPEYSPKLNSIEESNKDQFVPYSPSQAMLPNISTGAPHLNVTPKKPILRVGLSRRAHPKSLHSPN